MNKKVRKKKKKLRYDRLFLLLNIVVIAIVLCVTLVHAVLSTISSHKQQPVVTQPPVETVEPTATPQPIVQPTAQPTATPDLLDEKLTNPSSILFCANKKHPLPTDYIPHDLTTEIDVPKQTNDIELRKDAVTALEQMAQAALEDGVSLYLISGFRSAEQQYYLWNEYANQSGSDYADTISSRSGYSDHQTGLAVDIGELHDDYTLLDKSFADTEAGRWLYANAYRFGYILRYPQGKQDITGYDFEPWHYRYVGIDTATAMYNISPDETFEEYFQVEGGDYYD